MARAPFQVLIFPFFIDKVNGQVEYVIFKRTDLNLWQGISGRGEDDESFLEAAQRETFEESGIDPGSRFIALDSMVTIPAEFVSKHFLQTNGLYVIPEYSFGVEVQNKNICLSNEHHEYKWFGYQNAIKLLKYNSNHNALWELELRLTK